MDSLQKNRDRYWKALIVVSAVFCLFHLFLHARAPATDGDSFEYAGIARNIFERGELREDLIRAYTIKNQPLPHPAAQRANLYPFLLVPFYAVFRATQWTFIIPAFIGLFLLPLVAFRVGEQLFDPAIGFFSALLILFSSTILRTYTLMDPGQPEVWQMIFYILFAYALLKEKYPAAGLLMALAYLIRNNSVVLIPATLIWMFIHRRRALFGAPALKLFGAALIPALPFLIRSYIVFGSPFYSEQFAGISRLFGGMMIDRFAAGDFQGMIFNYDAFNVLSPPAIHSFAQRAGYIFQVLWINIKIAVPGSRTGVFYIPGVFQIIGPLLIPFLIIGLRGARKRPEITLLFIIFILQTAFHVFTPIYCDRYLLCVLPFVFFIAAGGIKNFQQWLAEKLSFRRNFAFGLILFILVSDSLGFIVMNSARLQQPRQANKIIELETTCDYIRRYSPGGAVIMTYPFFSTHFICGRSTVPMPYGNITSMAGIIKNYHVRWLIYTKAWLGDLFPELPFVNTVARGYSVSLFKVDEEKLKSYLDNPDDYFAAGINPVRYFLSNRFNFEMAPPFYKILMGITNSRIKGFLLYLILAMMFLYFYGNAGFSKRALPMILICLAVWSLNIAFMKKQFKPYMNVNPQISRIETGYLLKSNPELKNRRLIVFKAKNDMRPVAEDLGGFFKNPAILQNMPPPQKPELGDAFFVSVPPLTSWLSDEYSFVRNVTIQNARKEEVKKIVNQYERKGAKAAPVYGGVFIY